MEYSKPGRAGTIADAIITRNELEKALITAGEAMWQAEQEYIKARKELANAQQNYDTQVSTVTHWFSDLLLTSQRLNK
jgi:hypothetical protein